MSGGLGHRHAVGNHPHALGRRAVPHVEIAHAFAVDHHAAAAPGQRAIDGQLQPALPRIDAALADHDVLHAAGPGRRETVGVGGEHPGVDQIGPEPGHVLLQPPERLRIELPTLADDRQRNARLAPDRPPAARRGSGRRRAPRTRRAAARAASRHNCFSAPARSRVGMICRMRLVIGRSRSAPTPPGTAGCDTGRGSPGRSRPRTRWES